MTRIEKYKDLRNELKRDSDTLLIETLRKIKDNCCGKPCSLCQFENEDCECEIQLLTEALYNQPNFWDMEEIEKIVKGVPNDR